MSCELSKLAYSKIILHAFKYPQQAINGVLLANEGSGSPTLKYVDAIPLFHHNLGLAPMLEVALMQVHKHNSFTCNCIPIYKFFITLQIESYCKTAGLVIAGYYHASEDVSEMRYVLLE